MRLICIGALLAGLVPTLCFSQEADPNEAIESKRLVLESITCKGNENISCDFIRTKLRLHTGTELKDDDVQDAKLRLSALSNFKTVDIHLEKGTERGKAIVVVEVQEARSIATEFKAGLANALYSPSKTFRENSINTEIAARISNQNLFGHQKIFEFGLSGYYGEYSSTIDVNHSDANFRSASGDIAYIDPNFLGTERLFFSSGVSYTQKKYVSSEPTDAFGPTFGRYEVRTLLSGLVLGYRLWSFSYVDLSFSYRDIQTDNGFWWAVPELRHGSKVRTASVVLGWDSEDDPYFTTEGSRISAMYSVAIPCDRDCVWTRAFAYKKTWAITNRSVISVSIGGDPSVMSDRLRPLAPEYTSQFAYSADGLVVTYGHKIFGQDGDQLRNRWYVQLGTGPMELKSGGYIGGGADHATLMLGARFEVSHFGMINLYASGTRVFPQN